MCQDRAFLTYLMEVFAVDAGVREHVLQYAGQGV